MSPGEQTGRELDRTEAIACRHGSNGPELPAARRVTLSTVTRSEIEWLWPNRFAIGKLSLISGNPGLGKSTLSLEMAAHVSCGTHWPVDGGYAARGDTLILSAEDDIADTILPRLEAMQADVSRIHALTMIDYANEDGSISQRMFSLEKDINLLDEQLSELPDCRLVIIDPISAYMGHVDSHKNS
ncbi:MAG: AAA family ATPase, partial [Chloroflexi bacterium]|nr:AAA family ATPase [Chloroflexota bacterium]